MDLAQQQEEHLEFGDAFAKAIGLKLKLIFGSFSHVFSYRQYLVFLRFAPNPETLAVQAPCDDGLCNAQKVALLLLDAFRLCLLCSFRLWGRGPNLRFENVAQSSGEGTYVDPRAP